MSQSKDEACFIVVCGWFAAVKMGWAMKKHGLCSCRQQPGNGAKMQGPLAFLLHCSAVESLKGVRDEVLVAIDKARSNCLTETGLGLPNKRVVGDAGCFVCSQSRRHAAMHSRMHCVAPLDRARTRASRAAWLLPPGTPALPWVRPIPQPADRNHKPHLPQRWHCRWD